MQKQYWKDQNDKYQIQFNDYNNKLKQGNIMNLFEANKKRLLIKWNNAQIEAIDCEILYLEEVLNTTTHGRDIDNLHSSIKKRKEEIADLVEMQTELIK